jgi:nucleoside-diphosphate-sugar epimerase
VRILFTGGSSFTGYWFIRELTRAGHEVVAILRRRGNAYEGLRRMRVEGLQDLCEEIVEECCFGDDRFLGLIEKGHWDLLCHHAAEATNYKDSGFDALAALTSNARNVRAVVEGLAEVNCPRIALTGSVFEAGEGLGDERRAFSAYGLSKTLTFETFRFYAASAGIHLGKFVIPNPFGPLEEPRFTSYLISSWLKGEVPVVLTPDYVRDNIHVSLLSRAYVVFVSGLIVEPGSSEINPSQYRESQREFSIRVATELGPHLRRPCPVEFAAQTEFPEPRLRVNTDELDARALGWSETQAWEDLADFYLSPPDWARSI